MLEAADMLDTRHIHFICIPGLYSGFANVICRDYTGLDTLAASGMLRRLRDLGLLVQHSRASATVLYPYPAAAPSRGKEEVGPLMAYLPCRMAYLKVGKATRHEHIERPGHVCLIRGEGVLHRPGHGWPLKMPVAPGKISRSRSRSVMLPSMNVTRRGGARCSPGARSRGYQ